MTPQATSVPGALRVREVVDLVGGHYVRPVPTDELLEQFGLSGVRDRQCGGLSGGQQRRLMVALALVGRPALAVLDEPTTGLDVEGRDVLWSQLRESAERGSALLVTSHYLPDVEALTERVVVLNHGRVIADDHVGAIRARAKLSRLRFRTPRDQGSDAALRALPAVVAVAWPEGTNPGAERTHLSWRRVEVSSHDSDATVRGLVNACVDFAGLEITSATLEEAFRLLVAPGAERPLATATGAVTK